MKFSIKIENMAKNKPTICLIILLFVGVFIILMGMFISYAYFTANVQGTGKQITISRSKLIVHFNNGDELNETEISPGDTITKTFYVKNDTNSSETYRINWKYLVNNFKHSSNLKYTITSTNSGGTISNVTLPSTGTNIVIINSITIAANTTQTYTMTITYQNASQGNDDYDKNLIGKILITDTSGNEILPETSTGSYDREITAEKNLFNFTLAEAVDLLYPIGSIYTSTSGENPSVSFPGTTWERYGKGKTLVSLDENDTSFDTVNETGGTKDEVVPYHRHELNGVSAKAGSTNDDNNNGLHTHNITATTTTTGSTHTHTIAANGISVRNSATTTETLSPFSEKIKTDNPPSNNPTTTPGQQESQTDEGLIKGPNDDYGNPTYYFRGNVQDNYVSFAGKTWRIIRINGDGSVRLILNGTTGTSSVWNTEVDSTSGNTYKTTDSATALRWVNYNNSPVKTNADNWYNSNIGNNNTYNSMVATGKYCNDLSYTVTNNNYKFGAETRIKSSTATPQFTCPNLSDIYNLKVGLITWDEAAFAGGIHTDYSSNPNYYLSSLNNYFWTMSPVNWSYDFSTFVGVIGDTGEIRQYYLAGSYYVRPVINLKSSVVYVSGNGTSGSPYTVSFEEVVSYGDHGHEVSGSGRNNTGYIIKTEDSSDEHYHTIETNQISVSNSSTYTTGNNTNEGTHTHTIPSLTVTTTASTTGEGGKHVHTTGDHKLTAAETGVPSHAHGKTLALTNNTNLIYSSDAVGAARVKLSSSTGDYSYIRKAYNANGTAGRRNIGLSGSVSNNTAAAASSAHNHGNTGGATTSTTGSAHTHSIPALSGSTTASTTNGGTADGAHTHTIPSRTLTSDNSETIRIPGSSTTDGAHTHTIGAKDITFGWSGTTADSDHAGWHVHTLTIPSLTSTNNNAITITSTGAHQHTITGSATSAGAHEHTLSGYSGYAGTNESTTNKNLQPYITVYIWKRVS